MKGISWRPKSLSELDDVWARVAAEDVVAADRVVDRITNSISRLADHPRSGHLRDDLPKDFRVVNAGKYLVIYRELPDMIEIVAVRHGRTLLKNLS